MREKIESVKFENASIDFEGQTYLKKSTFEFPLNTRCRIVFHDEKEKYIFFHSMTQVESFTGGKYLINGKDVREYSFEEFLPIRLNMGFGFSTNGLIHNRTLRQNLELPLLFHKFKTPKEANGWINHMAEYFQINGDLNKRPSDVSPSVQKATLILRAFIHNPEWVLLDSPAVLLSKKMHANLLQLIDDQMKNHGLKHLMFATHDESLADCLAEQNIILNRGKLQLVVPKHAQRVAV